jgi:hypothetical protein
MNQPTLNPEGISVPYYYAATLTACAGTWLEQVPTLAEQQRIDAACKLVREQRRIAVEFHQDPQESRLFSLQLFRDPQFVPLYLSDPLIEQILATVGEPPVVDTEDDPAFANYLRQAVLSIATARVRSGLSGQVRRFLPHFVEREEWKAAVAIDSNAFRTALGNEVSPFLVQVTLGGLARWYDEHD